MALCGKRVGDEAIRHLKRNHELYSLTLHGDAITDAGLAWLQGADNLRPANRRGGDWTDAALEQIRNIDMLRWARSSSTSLSEAEGCGTSRIWWRTERD